MSVGRLLDCRAPMLALDAARRAHESCPALSFDFIGGDAPGGEWLEAASQLSEALGMRDYARLLGAVPHAGTLEKIAVADRFFMAGRTSSRTGRTEGRPVAMVEAMARGLPVVAMTYGGIPDLVVHGETGLLVPEGDHIGLARALVRLGKNPRLRRSLGMAAYERARARFSWERERARLLEILGLQRGREQTGRKKRS